MTTSPRFTASKPKRLSMAIGSAVVAAAAMAAATLIALHGGEVTASEQPVDAPAVPVSVATVIQAPVTAWEEYSGRLEAIEHVDIRSRVSGAVVELLDTQRSELRSRRQVAQVRAAQYQSSVD